VGRTVINFSVKATNTAQQMNKQKSSTPNLDTNEFNTPDDGVQPVFPPQQVVQGPLPGLQRHVTTVPGEVGIPEGFEGQVMA